MEIDVKVQEIISHTHLYCPSLSLSFSQNKLGDTALHNAAWKGHSEVVSMLMDIGASTIIRNKESQTPYDLAVKNPEVGRLLSPYIG